MSGRYFALNLSSLLELRSEAAAAWQVSQAKENIVTVTPFVCRLTAAADLATVLRSPDMRRRRRVGGIDFSLSLPIAAIYVLFLGLTELEFRFPQVSMPEHETGPRCGDTHSVIGPFKGWRKFKRSPPLCPPPIWPRTFSVSTNVLSTQPP